MNGWRVCCASSSDRGDLGARAGGLAERHQRRDPPLHRLGLDLDVADLLAERPRLGQDVERLVQARRPARPIGADQHGREPAPVADPPRHRDRLVADDLRAVASRPGTRARGRGPRARRHAASRRCGDERRRGLLEQLARALVVEPGAPAGVLEADRGAREQLAVAAARARCRPPARKAATESSDRPARTAPCRVAGASRPLRAHRRRRAAARCAAAPPPRRRSSAADAAAAAQQVVLDRARGVADRRRGGEMVGEVGEHAPAPATGPRPRAPRRSRGAARRGAAALSRSYSARRTSSCVKR